MTDTLLYTSIMSSSSIIGKCRASKSRPSTSH